MKVERKNFVIDLTVRVLSTLLLTLAFSALTLAQSGTSITGRVTDENGAAVDGAEVQLHARSGAQWVTLTDDHYTCMFVKVYNSLHNDM